MTPTLSAPSLPTPSLPTPSLPIPSVPIPSLLDNLLYRHNSYACLHLNYIFYRLVFVSIVIKYNIILLCMLSMPSIIAIIIINFYYYTSSFYATLTPCPPAFTTYNIMIVL